MSTSVLDIHNFLLEQDVSSGAHAVDSFKQNDDEEFVLGVELIVAFTASRFLNIESFLPPQFIAIFGTNNFFVHLVWLLILFFALRHFVAKEYQKRLSPKSSN
jgi:hypothetical protein